MYAVADRANGMEHILKIDAGTARLEGNLCIPPGAKGIVIFAHGSGSSRHSPRNQFVATKLNMSGLGTLLFDLLTPQEESMDLHTAALRFDIKLLSQRVIDATKWLINNTRGAYNLGYFGASTGAAAALAAASQMPDVIKAVVSRGGRPDLASSALPYVSAPTLFIVGERDSLVIVLNNEAFNLMPAATEKLIEIVPEAAHLFEEPGSLDRVADLASEWFTTHFPN